MSTEWNNTTKTVVSIGLVLFGLYILYLASSIIGVLIIAGLIAFLLTPVVDFIHHRLRLPRGLAVLLSILLLILIIVLSPLIFIPPVIDGFNALAQLDYQILVDRTLTWAEQTLLALKEAQTLVFGLNFNLDSVIDPALEQLRNTGSNITPTLPSAVTIANYLRSAVTLTVGVATNVAGTVASGVVTFIILLLSTVYLSLDARNFARNLLNLVPQAYRPEITKLFSRLRKTWRAYFRGQLNLMLIIGVVTWIGNTAIGLPGAFALAIIAGVMELIPNLGPFLAAVPAVIVALIQGSTYLGVSHLTFALIVIGLYILIQQIENTFVVPRVLGEAVDLHPLVVIIGVIVGANVAGILGALLAAPVIASIREILGYLYAKILGEDPYPPQPVQPEEVTPSMFEQIRLLWARDQRFMSRKQPAPAAGEEASEAATSLETSTSGDQT